MSRLGADLEALVRGRASRLVAHERIDPQQAARPARATFKLRFADGTLLKGRRLAAPDDARRVQAIVDRLDRDRFPEIVARRGAALLEAWIDGEVLGEGTVTESHLRWAGETLGAVHRAPCPAEAATPPDPAADLAWLVADGALCASEAGRLRARALARPPPPGPPGILHRDLCPENIVVDAAGRLFAVDNAAVRVGAPEEDLARTLYRWPMPAAAEAVFLDAYRAFRDPAGFLAHRAFWMIAVLAHAARVRRTHGYARADEPLLRLRAEAAAGAAP